jgi:proline iminopeptidase
VFSDQRGTGRSSRIDSAEQCKLSDQLADLEALVKALGAPRVDLLGHSWGGYLAMAFVARYPGLVQHLVLVDSAAPKWSETVFLFKEIYPEMEAVKQSRAFAEALGDSRDPKASLNDYFSMLFYSPEKRASFIAAAPGFSYSGEVNAALDADLQHFDLGHELPKFALPTLVITGRFDANVAPLTAYKIHQAIPRSRFVVFERSGHLPFIKEPEDFVRLVEEFLDAR